jgi:NAD(P)-dependent dehydrogenase (short-subunit alcohol dehydrogenase family)
MNIEHIGKNYLVIGASSGIGRSACERLAKLGANMILIARRSELLENTLQSMTQGNHAIYSFDVTNISEIQNILVSILDSYRKIDGCVYCVGSGDTPRLRDITYDRLHAVMLANFYAFIEFVRCLVKKKAKSNIMRIVCMSSLASMSNDKYLTAYAASKAAMDAAVRCLATELVLKNVTINSIRPAFVNTGRTAGLAELIGDVGEHLKKNGYQPQGWIPPEDVADLIVYLLSDAAKFITGTSVAINGGARC